MKHSLVRVFRALPVVLILMLNPAPDAAAQERTLAYLVPDIRITFWDIMARGIQQKATELGYELSVHSADNLARRELEATVAAIDSGVDGIILSPTANTLLCSHAYDVESLERKCSPPGVSRSCIPGCTSREGRTVYSCSDSR